MAWTERYVTVAGAGAHDGTSEANAWTLTEAFAATSSSSGIRLNIKNGSYSDVDGFGWTITGGSYISLRGYNSAIGDLTPSRNADGTLNTTNFPTIDLTAGAAGMNGMLCDCIKFTGSAVASLFTATSAGCSFRGCTFTNSFSNANSLCLSLGSGNTAAMCDFTITGSSSLVAVTISNTGGALFDCRVTGKNGMGVRSTGSAAGKGLTLVNCVIYDSTYGVSNEATSIALGNPFHIIGCTIKGNSNDGIRGGASSNTSGNLIVNNHITDNGGYGYNSRAGSSNAVMLVNNRFRDNTSGATNTIGDQYSLNAVTTDNGDATTDYVDHTNKNFFLKQGAAGRRASLQRNQDIGAHQSAPQFVGAVGG